MIVVPFLEVTKGLNKIINTELVLLFVVYHIEPKTICQFKSLLTNFHWSFHWLSPLYCFFNYAMYPIQIYSSFPNQIVIAYYVPVPDLNNKHIWVHILRFRRVAHWKLKSVIKVPSISARPMSISLLWLSTTNHASYKDIIWLQFSVLMHTIFSTPNDNPKLVLIARRWMNFMNRSR